MTGKSVTIRDVANQAGVSVSTVSRILSGGETPIAISKETRERVLQVTHKLSYRPHPGARSLRGKSTNLLGLIVREIDDPFFVQLIKVLNAEAKNRGLEIVLGHAEADPNTAVRLGQVMLNMRYCDGIFLLGDLGEAQDDLQLLSQINRDLPVVIFCRGAEPLDGTFSSVTTDNCKGVNLALEYLAGLGHSRIAYLGSGRSGDFNERLEAYCHFMQQHYPEQILLQHTENSMEGGFQGMLRILGLPQRPTAVFAADDTIAIGALRAAAVYGCQVPQQLSIIGFDDIKSAAYTVPALTTIQQPVELMGQAGLERMIGLITKGDNLSPNHISIEPTLVVRKSCSALP